MDWFGLILAELKITVLFNIEFLRTEIKTK